MPENWWDSEPDAPDDGNWWDSEPDANPVAAAWHPRSSSAPAPASRPSSFWEDLQQGASGIASDEAGIARQGAGLLGGIAKEAPLVAARAAKLPMDILSGAVSKGVDWLGTDSMKKADLQRSVQNAEA